MKQTPEIENLFRAILSLENEEECNLLFEDICTVKELQAMAQRLTVAAQLSEGKNYNAVSESTGASSATISRVNKCLLYGDGGYKLVLERMEEKEC
jgi:TrpR-related protein YerC/YecD